MFSVHAMYRRILSKKHPGKSRPFAPGESKSSITVESLEDRTLMSAVSLAMPILSGDTPAQIRSAYGLNGLTFGKTAADGHGQTIAIVDPENDPNISADLDAFDKAFTATSAGASLYQQYGAASALLTVYNQNGQVINPVKTTLPVDLTGGWEREIALDVELAHAIAPAAKIDLIECNSAATNDLLVGVAVAARLPGVSVVAMNWGVSEFTGENAFDSVFTTSNGHQGVTFLAPSGDTGAPGNYPAYSPNVVAVGGTSLVLNSNSTIRSETAWSGSGGGTSSIEVEPAYQLGVQKGGRRSIPDVAFDADPSTGVWVYNSYGAGAWSAWKSLAGTSLATPAWAGMIAIANEGRALAGTATLNGGGDPTQALTALYSLPSSDFHDIIAGSNGAYRAGPGYDYVTGRGSPVANRLIPDLVNYRTGTRLSVTAQPPANVTPGKPFSITVKALDNFGNVVPGFTGNVSLSLANNPGGSILGGKLTVKAVKGVATFSGLTLNKAGMGYELQASSPQLSSAMTNSFNETTAPLSKTVTPVTFVHAMDEPGAPATLFGDQYQYWTPFGAYGSNGYSYGIPGLGWSNDGLQFGLGSLNYTPATSTFSFGSPFVGGDFSPYSTTLWGGFGYQEGFNFPYGYQSMLDWGASQAEPYFGQANDPNYWMNYSDPFGHSVYGY